MSTALPEPSPSPSQQPDHGDTPAQTNRHLESVTPPQLRVTPVAGLPRTVVKQVGHLHDVPKDPTDEYEPSRFLEPRRLANAFPARKAPSSQRKDPHYLRQVAAIKKMTQTIGAAFIEAELGIRPYMQLSAWMELEVFHKLRARVEHSVNEKYLAARRGEEGSKKVPSIETLGVRAAPKANGEWESSMTIRVGQRARAIAMRLQLHRDRWRVIAFEVG